MAGIQSEKDRPYPLPPDLEIDGAAAPDLLGVGLPGAELSEAKALDPKWVVGLLRLGLGIAAATMVGMIVRAHWLDPGQARLEVPYCVIILASLLAAGVLSFSSTFARHWKAATLACCLLVIGQVTYAYIMLGQQIPVFVTILVLLTATCALIPWEYEWQAALTVGMIAAGVVATVAIRPASPYLAQLWLSVLTSAIMALVGIRRLGQWRVALSETHHRLKESAALQRKLLDANMDSVSLIRDGRYLYVNKGFLKRGYSYRDVLGKSVEELAMAAPAEVDKLRDEIAAHGFAQNVEINLRKRDGTTVPHLVSAVPVDLNGERCTLSVARDIAEIKQIQNDLIAAQHRLQQSESKLRKIFEACPDSICINSLVDGRFIDINPQFALSGYSREQMMREPAQAVQIWASQRQHLRFLQDVIERGVVHNRPVDFKMKDGNIRPCLLSAAIVELDGERCLVTFSSDMSQLKRVEQELISAKEAALAASRAKSEFLSSMSHEIRTPLNAIMGMADLLAETPLTSEQARFVATMTRNSDALLSLINAILDLARIEAGRMNLERAEFDLEELVEQVADTLSVRAHEKGLELTCRMAGELPRRVVGDALRVRQVLINLVANAIKFTERGEVALTVRKHADVEGGYRLLFSVRDTGIGIPSEKLSSIFNSFTQADSSTTRKHGGSGLGLAIASRLVELMGGKVWAESEVGEGSTFSFVARFGIAEELDVKAEESTDLKDSKVLVVDDNATNRSIQREILSLKGAAVDEADDAAAALSRIEQALGAGQPYTFVLMDCRMAGTDGFDAVARIKQTFGNAVPLVLMLTPEDLNQKLPLLREMRLNAYVVKPVRRLELMRAVGTIAGPAKGARQEVSPPIGTSGPETRPRQDPAC